MTADEKFHHQALANRKPSNPNALEERTVDAHGNPMQSSRPTS